MTKNTISTKEIMARLGVSPSTMCKLRRDANSTMPLPLNSDCRMYQYQRDAMETWINEQLLLQQQEKMQHGLDNQMAQAFIRR